MNGINDTKTPHFHVDNNKHDVLKADAFLSDKKISN
jgi:hypothetical protein